MILSRRYNKGTLTSGITVTTLILNNTNFTYDPITIPGIGKPIDAPALGDMGINPTTWNSTTMPVQTNLKVGDTITLPTVFTDLTYYTNTVSFLGWYVWNSKYTTLKPRICKFANNNMQINPDDIGVQTIYPAGTYTLTAAFINEIYGLNRNGTLDKKQINFAPACYYH